MQPLQTETSADMQLSHEYNAQGQRTASHASAPSLPTRTTAYAWRPHGSAGAEQIATLTNALGQQSRFEYDSAGRLARHTLPDGRAIAYQRDASGNLTLLRTPESALSLRVTLASTAIILLSEVFRTGLISNKLASEDT